MSQKNALTSASKFRLNGRPGMKEVVSLGLQHVLAVFVGDAVPMILVTSATGLPVRGANMSLQCCMLGAAISITTQLYSIRTGSTQIGSGLSCMMGFTYVFLSACLSTADSRGVLYIFGAQITAGIIAVDYGTLLKKISSSLPPVVMGAVAMTAGVSIFNLATGDIAGGISSPDFGTSISWAVGAFVVPAVLGFSMLGEGLPKVVAILIGMMAGYILSITLGLVSFLGIGEAAWFVFPKPFTLSVKFDLGCTLMSVLLYFIVAVQMIGDLNVSCMDGLDCELTPNEIGGGATANGITSIISATLNGFPIATYSQNPGIMALTRVCSRSMTPVGCEILFLAGLCPKTGAMLSTTSNYVIGGGTMVVLAMTATSGMKLFTKAGHSNRNCLIIGVSLAFGLDTQSCKGISTQFPAGIAAMLEENSVILTSLLTTTLNLVFPRDSVQAEEPADKVQ